MPAFLTQIVRDCKDLRRERERYRLDAVLRGRGADKVIAR
jgi:hypothetical protein